MNPKYAAIISAVRTAPIRHRRAMIALLAGSREIGGSAMPAVSPDRDLAHHFAKPPWRRSSHDAGLGITPDKSCDVGYRFVSRRAFRLLWWSSWLRKTGTRSRPSASTAE